MNNAQLKGNVLAFLDKNKLMTLATVKSTEPWTVTLTYAFDEECNLLFFSDPETKHCQDILQNPHVAVAIHSDNLKPRQIQGIQLIGIAEKGSPKDLATFGKRHPWVADYPNHTLCKVKPTKLYYLDSELLGHKNKVEVELK